LSPRDADRALVRVATRLLALSADPSEFLCPAPHGFVADDDPARSQHVLDHSQTEGKPEIEPNRVLEDLGGELIAAINRFDFLTNRTRIAEDRRHFVNLTVPVLDALKAKGLDVRPDDLVDLRKDRR
jgi:hypothetical protein